MAQTLCQTRFIEGGQCNPVWQCPYCDHSLSYMMEHEDVAKLAIVSHLVRCHKMSFWQVRSVVPNAKKQAEEFFGDDVW